MRKLRKAVKELRNQYEETIDKSQERSIDQMVCYRCGDQEHYLNKCKVEGVNTIENEYRPRQIPVCYGCNRKGHYVRNCPEKRRKEDNICEIAKEEDILCTNDKIEKGQIVCHRCHRTGHYAKGCRKRDNECKNRSKKGHYMKKC